MNYKKVILSGITLMGTMSALSVVAEEKKETITTLDEVSVIGTREAQSLSETALSIGVVKKQDIEDIKQAHPSEIMQRIPGVHVNVTGGEGEMKMEGLNLMGYDRRHKKFTTVVFDTWGTYYVTGAGPRITIKPNPL